MSQIVIDGVLFSPVLAHALEPGDLFTLPACLEFKHVPTRRVLEILSRANGKVTFTRSHPVVACGVAMSRRTNDVVYRAVGARAARGGAR